MEEKIKKIDELMLIEEPTFEECMELDRLLLECTTLIKEVKKEKKL